MKKTLDIIGFMLVNYLIVNNSTAQNVNSTTSLLKYVNGGVNNALGMGILLLIFTIAFGVLSYKVDVVVGGVAAGFIGSGLSLFLQQLGLVSPNTILLFGGITLIFSTVAMFRAVLKPY